MNWKSTAVVSGAGLLATWLGWNTQPVTPVSSPSPVVPAAAAPAAGRDIAQQAARLQTRVREVTDYRDPIRDPFRFAAHAASHPRANTVPPATPFAFVAPAPVQFNASLAGIASDDADGTITRTAIFSTPSGVVLAHEGESVGSGFRVTTIGENAVDIVDADGAVRTLTLRP